MASDEIRQHSWRNRFTGERVIENALPNNGHKAVARLIEEGKASAVITQNIDNLHQESGVPDDHVIELHGNTRYAKCMSCELRYEMADLEDQFSSSGKVNPCSRCGGVVKTATISFGQAMPEDAMMRAQTKPPSAICSSSSARHLSVYPAAGFPEIAKRLGAQLVILNRDDTPLDPIADLVLHAEIGPTMSFVVGIN